MVEAIVVQDTDQAISVMHQAGTWLEKSGKKPSKWWQPSNMTRDFLLLHAEPSEFYVVLVAWKPAAAVILQDNQRNQSWEAVDKSQSPRALYIHWLCVARPYAGKGLPKILIDFAEQEARRRCIDRLRADTNAAEAKLMHVYEHSGFRLVSIVPETYRQTAFYQKMIK